MELEKRNLNTINRGTEICMANSKIIADSHPMETHEVNTNMMTDDIIKAK